MERDWAKWFKAAGIRAIRTVAQAAIAAIGSTAVFSEVNWAVVGYGTSGGDPVDSDKHSRDPGGKPIGGG